jgi:cobalt-precorrin 5A hydrolase/precorrin-3B C17-methyltransferase
MPAMQTPATQKSGRVAVVGLGPGSAEWRTPEAQARLAEATDLVGYRTYLKQAGPFEEHQRCHSFNNRQEAARAAFALDLAAEGKDVAVVSSGDPGIFAMATAVIEELHRENASGRWDGVEVTIVPGVTAAFAAAARIGAPLGHDLCLISLSDVLKPWEVIVQRLAAAAGADFVIGLYNPLSRHRPWQLARALEILGRHRGPGTPVVQARNVGRPDETVAATTLGEVDPDTVDMSTILLIGSSTTQAFTDGGGRQWVYTPRHYPALSEAPPSDAPPSEAPLSEARRP